jgi:type I restriction enzyme S subunit
MTDKYINAKKKEAALLQEEKQAIINQAVTKAEGLQTKRLRNIFSLGKGLNITKANLQSTGIPCISYGQVHSKYGFEVNPDVNELPFVSEYYRETNPQALLRFGDFIFADTSEDIAGSGNFTCFNGNSIAFAGYHTIIARPAVPINYRYTAYLFDSPFFRSQIQKEVVGVKVFSISRSILNNTVLSFPSKEVQASVVDYLDEKCFLIRESISHLTQEINLLTEYRAHLISDVVTGKVDVRDVKVPDANMETKKNPSNTEEMSEYTRGGNY